MAAISPPAAAGPDVSHGKTQATAPDARGGGSAHTPFEIAYTVDRQGPNHLYLSSLAGGDRELLAKGRDPAWSPDGERLTYRTGNPQRGGGIPTKVHVIRRDGAHTHVYEPRGVYGEASGEAGPIVWSPNGNWLAFDSLSGIYAMRPNGEDLRLVSAFPGHRRSCYDLEPSWSSNGRRLVFAVLCDGGNLGLWTVGIKGQHRSKLLGTDDRLVAAYQPAWSPDGRRIVFVGVRDKRHQAYSYDLYSIRSTGGRLLRLTSGPGYPSSPAWSPTGRRISFSQYGRGVFMMRRDGSHITELDLGRHACCLAWNPAAA